MLRGIVAVIAGYLVFAVCSAVMFAYLGRDPHALQDWRFMAGTVAAGMLFGWVSGRVTASLATRKPLLWVIVLALLLASIATASIFAAPAGSSIWTEVSVLALIVPATLLGGWRRARAKEQEG